MSKQIKLSGKKYRQINMLLDISDEENPRVLDTIEEQEIRKLPALPDSVFEVKSEWLRSNWDLQHIVDANSYVEKFINGRASQVYDPNANVRAQVRIQLKSWNLHELDVDLRLVFEKSVDDPSLSILDSDTMRRVGKIDPPTIINTLVNRMMIDELEKSTKPKKKDA